MPPQTQTITITTDQLREIVTATVAQNQGAHRTSETHAWLDRAAAAALADGEIEVAAALLLLAALRVCERQCQAVEALFQLSFDLAAAPFPGTRHRVTEDTEETDSNLSILGSRCSP